MNPSDITFPSVLSELHKIEIDYANGEGVDFEPYTEFRTSYDSDDWLKAWTGNDQADGSQFKIFGQDGTGGYAAFWIFEAEKPLLKQPIVFMGSEGERGVVASDFDSYLWLLASGVGPLEAVTYPEMEVKTNKDFDSFAKQNSQRARMTRGEVLEKAKSDYPYFSDFIDSLCR